MDVLTVIIIVLIVLWLTGTVIFPVGNLVHVLLVIALIILIVRLSRGQKIL